MNKITNKITLFAVMLVIAVFNGCSKEPSLNLGFNTEVKPAPAFPDVSFAVISDIHVYNPELGSSGSAFEQVLSSDRKLLLDSFDLLEFAIDEIIASGVNFVLISGDLTKDGEYINHIIVADKLRRLLDANINVYVIPGNHDVNCPHAFKYIDDRTESIASVTEEGFAQIHGDLGYNAAIMRDNNSLSYVAELQEGFWLLAIDSTRCRENVPGGYPYVSGKIIQETADWIASVLREADSRGIAVMAMMHHGFMEHWKGQAKLHPDYIVEDFSRFTKFLSSWNVRAGFTGHYHANDITRADFDNGKFFYDIETGSLVTAPCPIRYVNIIDNVMEIRSDFIIDKIHPGTDFAHNAHAFVKRTVMLEASNVLKRYKVSDKDIAIITDAVGDAFAAHYSGNEDPSLRPALDKSKLSLWGRFILSQQKYALDGLWNDLPPPDIEARLEF